MFQRRYSQVLAGVLATVLLSGCMPKMTLEDMKAMMPQRPAELDALNAFVGSWTGTGEAKMAGLDEPVKTSGTSEVAWEGDGWYLVERGAFTMADFDDMHALGTWTYDSHSKLYRSTWTDSMGGVGTGTARIDKNGIWRMRATSHGAFGKSTAKGHVKFLDADTAEWTWTEYAMGGLIKTMEMTGTNRRR